MPRESAPKELNSLIERFDVAIHLACDFYSSPMALAKFPGFARHHVGAMYCWLLKLDNSEWQILKGDVERVGFERAVLFSLKRSGNVLKAEDKTHWTAFLPHLLIIHVYAVIDLVSEANSSHANEEMFSIVFQMFDQTQQTFMEKKVWASVIDSLVKLKGE